MCDIEILIFRKERDVWLREIQNLYFNEMKQEYPSN